MGCSSSNALNDKKVEDRKKVDLLEQPCVETDFATNFFDHYCFDVKLGQGSFAEVWLVASLPSATAASGDTYEWINRKPKCVKILETHDERGKPCPVLGKLVAMEVHIAKMVGHYPNVVTFYGAFKQQSTILLVMEKCNCSLSDYMKDLVDLNENSLGKLVFQMLHSLHHLHSLRIVHRDIKADNFLIGGPNGHTVKLCDFGLAALLPAHGKLCAPVGTISYMCPEMYGGLFYDLSADIWSLGVTTYRFLYGAFPYVSKDGTKQGMMRAILKGTTPTFETADKRRHQCSPDACNFVRALLERVGNLRPSAKEALNFPYMVKVMYGRHENNVPLPSFRPESHAAKKIGVISSGKPSAKTGIDNSDIGLDHIPLSRICERSPECSTACGSALFSPTQVSSSMFSPMSSLKDTANCSLRSQKPATSFSL